jgi:arylsulfatase A-like enzyme
VPLLARWPGRIPAGQKSEALVEITDLVASCLHAASGEDDVERWLPRSPARSLIPLWNGAADAIRDFVYSEDGGQFYPAYQMIRTPEWKYTLYTDKHRESLFQMLDDPDECVDRANDLECRTIREALKTQLLTHMAQTVAPVRD